MIRRRGDGLPPDQHADILQEVLLAIHLKRQTWRRDAPVRPWLYALARYKVVDAFRRRGAVLTLPIEDFAEVLPEENAAVPLSGRDAEVMLGMIDARSARLVRAVALDGQTAEEAGEAVGMTAGAARVALHRAMRRLSGLTALLRNVVWPCDRFSGCLRRLSGASVPEMVMMQAVGWAAIWHHTAHSSSGKKRWPHPPATQIHNLSKLLDARVSFQRHINV